MQDGIICSISLSNLKPLAKALISIIPDVQRVVHLTDNHVILGGGGGE